MHKQILLVDKDPVLSRILKQLLGKQGHDVQEVHNGKEALLAMQSREYDLILMDTMLPYANGLELITRFRKDRQHDNTPIMILSGINHEDTLKEYFNIGADDYLRKPFIPAELIYRTNRLLSRKEPLSVKMN